MCKDKGLHTVVEAFIALRRSDRCQELRLAIAGVQLREDRSFVEGLRARLAAEGLHGHVEFLPNLDRKDKLAFLRTLSVLSVPATYGESFGLYLLEAMACGVPVVQPDHAAFPEILAATGGGILCAPDDPQSLADGIETLLRDLPRAQELADRGRRAVLEHFHAERMAREFAGMAVRVMTACGAPRQVCHLDPPRPSLG
jgi:glycosyltransferase involved in cell wall biosynthesis